jgi:uncharacterized protein YdeI (YjbR/CyaY-like superfamily)
MPKKDTETFCPTSQKAWRQWLKANHKSKDSIWLILYKKESNKPIIGWSDAVDEALCFGWVDSKRKPIDDEKFMQFFSKRKSKGTWSRINKEKVQQLIDKRLMTKAGFGSIETAKQNGSWIILDDVEELTIPKDLAKVFRAKLGSKDYFMSLSKSVRKSILQWIVLAKRPETRQKRINEIAELAALGLKPKQFR